MRSCIHCFCSGDWICKNSTPIEAESAITIKVKYKGNLENTVLDYLGGIRSTCTYINAKNIKNISKCCTFMRVSRQLNMIYA